MTLRDTLARMIQKYSEDECRTYCPAPKTYAEAIEPLAAEMARNLNEAKHVLRITAVIIGDTETPRDKALAFSMEAKAKEIEAALTKLESDNG